MCVSYILRYIRKYRVAVWKFRSVYLCSRMFSIAYFVLRSSPSLNMFYCIAFHSFVQVCAISIKEKNASKIVSMIRKYHNHKPQTTPRHREEEPLNHHTTLGRQIKQSNQLSLSHQDDCNTSNGQQNIEHLQTPTMGVTINKRSATTEPPP